MDEPRLDPVGNVPEFTVSEISGAVKRTLEGNFGRVRVRGEITELKRYPSGHIYFSLKDEGAKLAGIVWKFAVARLGMQPENGVEVIATGRITSYAERSSYQLIVERMEYAGAGALLARIEALRLRLAGEGLFDAARKRAAARTARGDRRGDQRARRGDPGHPHHHRAPLPAPDPAVAGAGAGRGRGRTHRRGDRRVRRPAGGWPGHAVPRPDVLIVARGGGSLEDLMAFNEEVVVRAAAACRIPLISAVGHETDTTLIDFAADRRAPTPTAAAEMAVPARADLLADLAQTAARLIGALNRLTQDRRLRLSRAERGLPDLPALLGTARQRLDDRAERLRLALPNLVRGWAARLTLARSTLAGGLRHTLAARRDRAVRVLARVSPAPLAARLREARARLEGAAGRLESVSPLAVLQRGYALVTDPLGHPLTTAAAVRPGAPLRLRFADGEVGATAEGGGKPERQGRLSL